MRVFVCLCIFAGTLLSGNPQSFWENRFGIVPLHSTRAKVERLYGVCGDSLECTFQTTKETINVAYATAPCAGLVDGWNAPKDTVVLFTVRPNVPPRFSETVSALSGFVERHNPHEPGTTYYTNVENGIIFAVQDGHVIRVTYFPPSNENGKRCQGFPAYDGVPPPRPFDVVLNPNNARGILDTLGAELARIPQLHGYIIAYAGRKSRREEAKQMAQDARRYLIETRMIPPDRITAIDGGFREAAQYDLFTQTPAFPPPTPTPTVPSNEVQIIRTTPRNKGRYARRF